MHFDYLIIGNSAAGVATARSIRKLDKISSIALITQNNGITYNTCLFSQVLSQNKSLSEAVVYSPERAAQDGITIIPQTCAHALVSNNKSVLTQNNQQFFYNKLVLATGTKPAPVFFEQPVPAVAVTTYHTAQDIQEIDRLITAHTIQKVLIVGGGINGIECASALHKRALPVTLIDRSRILGQLPESCAGWVKAYLQRSGIAVHEYITIDDYMLRINPDGLLVIMATGVRPALSADFFTDNKPTFYANTDFLVVDTNFRTTIPDVYAVGDAAYRYQDGLYQPPSFLWSAAFYQGCVLGRLLAGSQELYQPLSYYQVIHCGELSLYIYWHNCLPTTCFFEEKCDTLTYSSLMLNHNNEICGFITSNAQEALSLKASLVRGS